MAKTYGSSNSRPRSVDGRGVPLLLLTAALGLGLARAPYSSWQGQHFAEPGPWLAERPPLPLAEPPERARRLFELNPELALTLPECTRRGGPGCAELAFGSELSLSILIRQIPAFAFGAEARRFSFDHAASEGPSKARASALFAGFAARVYFMDRGSFDPFLQLTLGGGSLGLEAGNALSESATLVPALRSAAGCDITLWSWMRIGAFLGYTRYFPASVSHCNGQACIAVPASQAALAVGGISLGLRLTIAAGERL
jgi:hypothetical protein